MRIISGLLVLIVCLRNGIGAEGDPELPADFVAKASTQGNYQRTVIKLPKNLSHMITNLKCSVRSHQQLGCSGGHVEVLVQLSTRCQRPLYLQECQTSWHTRLSGQLEYVQIVETNL